jgi:hypothetical protein
MIESTNATLEAPITMYAINDCSHKARSRKKGRIAGICEDIFSDTIF